MFRSNRGIIEPGRHRMGQFDLAFFIGEQESFCSLEDTETSALETGGMFTAANSFAARFDANHQNMSILQKRIEQTDGVTTAANASNE